MIDQSQVTIIIPHLGEEIPETKFALRQCLESLQETVPNIKKILVINGLGFEKEFTLLDGDSFLVTDLTIMVLEEQGQCKAVNAAAATVNTPWIFVTNDDMIYAPGWWERLNTLNMITRDVSLDDQNMLCISPVLVEPRKGAPTFIEYFCGGAGGDFDKAKWLEFAKDYPRQPQAFRTGFNLPFLISKELWDTIGGYDINYDPWGSNSDSDLEYKIKLAGVQPYQNSNCIVYHFSQTSGTFEPRNHEYWQKNFAYFKEKWGFERTDEGIWEASFTIPGMPERTFWPAYEGKYGSKNA